MPSDPKERFHHLVVAGTADPKPYVQPSQGGRRAQPLYPRRDPDVHGRALVEQLRQVTLEQPQLQEQMGSYLTFELELNKDLPLDSLEDRRAGIELVAFREQAQGPATATVFVPEGKLKVFERKLADYLDPEKIRKEGRRRNEALVNSIQQIRRALLRDLWTDPVREFPSAPDPLWWEVWIRARVGVDRFRDQASALGIQVGRQVLLFPDRSVVLARATVAQMTLSVDLLDSIAELREARSLACELLEMDHREEAERVASLHRRIEPPPEGCPAVCILDTGVDVGHPLLHAGLPATSALAYDEVNWGVDDHQGHGTQMAGFALYGEDLAGYLLTEGSVQLRHQIESVKILPRQGSNPPELYGEITQASSARVETHDALRSRAYSLSITSEKCPEGRPTSWSAAVDQMCIGTEEGLSGRLVFVSSGNASLGEGYSYPDSNQTDCIQDPAQAWNALTVGAYTEKTLIHEPDYRDWGVVAPAGDMSPCNTTSLPWRSAWPNKPDLVLEGGNMAWDPANGNPDPLDSLSLLTTRRRGHSGGLLCWSGDTSAATAAGARLGALLLAEYPDLSPETVRALLVHSARWTPAMQQRFAIGTPRQQANNLLRCYGFGVPDLDRALYSLQHQLTLVVQEAIQPFDLDDKGEAKSHEMHLHRLPWPSDVLERLGNTEVRMRVTLSYFIEPKPGHRGPSRRHRYASFGLRFAVKTARENERAFLKRINKASREEGGETSTDTDSGQWVIGPECRHRGSIHSDVWQGHAIDLASKDAVAIFPVIGWWRDRKRPDRCLRKARYALVVSIESDAAEVEIEGEVVPVDFYTEVLNVIELSNAITIENA